MAAAPRTVIPSVLPSDLTTVAEVQEFMAPDGQGNDSGTQALLQTSVSAASRFIASYCGRTFEANAAVTEVRNGTDQPVLWMRRRPVWGLTSVAIGSVPVAVVNDQISSGVTFDENALYTRGWYSGTVTGWVGGSVRFIRGVKNVVVVYSGGWNTPGQYALSATVNGAPDLPMDIQQACDTLISYWYKRRRNLANASVGEGPERISFFTKDMPDHVKLMLNLYKSAFVYGWD